MSSLYRRDLPRSCATCMYGQASVFEEESLCAKRGVTKRGDSCRRYRYDPLKRIPQKKKLADDYRPEDFSLD